MIFRMTNAAENRPEGERRLAETFGARLARLREEAGIDATELGRRAGMTQAYVWRLENGRALPSLRNLARFALALECPLPSLLEDVDYQGIELDSRQYRRG
ncbi:hypothetical protein A3711_07425 [Erythrobacter sp. HI00D59]|jgi:transcriptional regulator with XRE-family HTH domain|nr:hypothetical protein A3711_07425 [Erythrobacter sp. HI00D59]